MYSALERDALVLQHLPIVKGMAGKLHMRLPLHLNLFQDLISAGCIGLMDAIDNYQPDTEVPFLIYARFRIKGEMLDSLRRLSCVPRDIQTQYKLANTARLKLAQALGRFPTDAEVAEHLGIANNRLQLLKRVNQPTVALATIARALPTPETISSSIEDKQRTEIVRKAIYSLPKRDRQIIALYYWRGLTMKKIGKIMGIHESRVSQIHSEAADRLARYFTARCITANSFHYA